MKDDDGPVRVTVLTATFNRAHTLPRVYQSLCNQTFTDFEWLIIDDGSTDDTAALVESWRAEGVLRIRYFAFANRGKVTSLNRGVARTRSEYCAMLDSDDWYPPDALALMIRCWESIPEPNRAQFANVEGLSTFADGTLIGSPFPADVFDSDNLRIRYLREQDGDTHGMYRTQVLREFPFPEEFRYVRESLVWNRIAQRYRTRFFNGITGIKEYLEGGLTRTPLRQRIARGRSEILYYQELLALHPALPRKDRRQAAVVIASLAMHLRMNPIKLLRASEAKGLLIANLPLALLRYSRQRMRMVVRPGR